MTRPSGARWSSPGRISAVVARFVTSKTAFQRLDAVSLGLKTRKFFASALSLSEYGGPHSSQQHQGIDVESQRENILDRLAKHEEATEAVRGQIQTPRHPRRDDGQHRQQPTDEQQPTAARREDEFRPLAKQSARRMFVFLGGRLPFCCGGFGWRLLQGMTLFQVATRTRSTA